MDTNSIFFKICYIVLLLFVSSNSNAWSEEEMVGTHIFEGVDGFALFTKTHLLWIYYDENRMDIESESPADKELARLIKTGESVGGTYKITGPGRMYLDITHAMDPRMVGQHWEYEYENLENNRIRYWVLNNDGTRSERTGVGRKIN